MILFYQNYAFPGVLGKHATSLMFYIPATIITNLQKPRPKPPCGTVPYLLKSKYHQQFYFGSFSLSILPSRTSSLSSLCDPPTIYPTSGARISNAATVLPSSLSLIQKALICEGQLYKITGLWKMCSHRYLSCSEARSMPHSTLFLSSGKTTPF